MIASSLGIRGGRMEGLGGRAIVDKQRAATPARIMVPRVIFAVTALALVMFGLLMIYSSSSIMGLTSEDLGHDPTYFVIRQAEFAGAGVLFAAALAFLDYRMIRGPLLWGAWFVTLLLLVVVLFSSAGLDAYGATRWIAIGPFTLQPSEFAKVAVLLVGANLAVRIIHDGTLYGRRALILVGVGVVLPLLLIFVQPDKGTTGVAVLSLIIMCYLSGVPGKWIAGFSVLVLAIGLAYAFFIDDYSRARILTVFHPFDDEYGSGYQLAQGLYALGSGGLKGVGLGLSRQKYNYLPMAHNDFIFAIVGEELGFIGAIGLLLAFAVLLWAGFKIAEQADDLLGKLIAAGCTSMIFVQLLLNVSGVIGLFPLSGKPVPFISYGGSSVISSLALVGLVMSVSLHSTLPETAHELRRSEMRVTDDLPFEEDDVRSVTLASSRRTSTSSRRHAQKPRTSTANLRMVRGGRYDEKPKGRITTDASGRRRLDLGPTPSERFRAGRDRRRER